MTHEIDQHNNFSANEIGQNSSITPGDDRRSSSSENDADSEGESGVPWSSSAQKTAVNPDQGPAIKLKSGRIVSPRTNRGLNYELSNLPELTHRDNSLINQIVAETFVCRSDDKKNLCQRLIESNADYSPCEILRLIETSV